MPRLLQRPFQVGKRLPELPVPHRANLHTAYRRRRHRHAPVLHSHERLQWLHRRGAHRRPARPNLQPGGGPLDGNLLSVGSVPGLKSDTTKMSNLASPSPLFFLLFFHSQSLHYSISLMFLPSSSLFLLQRQEFTFDYKVLHILSRKNFLPSFFRFVIFKDLRVSPLSFFSIFSRRKSLDKE